MCKGVWRPPEGSDRIEEFKAFGRSSTSIACHGENYLGTQAISMSKSMMKLTAKPTLL